MSPQGDVLARLQALQDEIKAAKTAEPSRQKTVMVDAPKPSYVEGVQSRVARGAQGFVEHSVGDALGLAAFSARKAGAEKVAQFFERGREGVSEGMESVWAEQRAKVDAFQSMNGNTLTRFFERTLPGATGATLPLIVGGKGLGALGRAAGLGEKGLLGATKLGVAATGATSGGVGQYYEARAAGADESTATKAFFLGAAGGLSEGYLGFGRRISELDQYVGGAIGKTLVRMALDSGEEFAQNKVQRIWNDLSAQGLYDPQREVFLGLDDEDAAAAVLGLLAGGAAAVGARAAGQPQQGTPAADQRPETAPVAVAPAAQASPPPALVPPTSAPQAALPPVPAVTTEAEPGGATREVGGAGAVLVGPSGTVVEPVAVLEAQADAYLNGERGMLFVDRRSDDAELKAFAKEKGLKLTPTEGGVYLSKSGKDRVKAQKIAKAEAAATPEDRERIRAEALGYAQAKPDIDPATVRARETLDEQGRVIAQEAVDANAPPMAANQRDVPVEAALAQRVAVTEAEAERVSVDLPNGRSVPVANVEAAARAVREDIERSGIGSSEWLDAVEGDMASKGTAVRDASGKIIARVSYNGRLWSPDGGQPYTASLTPESVKAEIEADESLDPEVTQEEVAQEERRQRPRGGARDEAADLLRSEGQRLGVSTTHVAEAIAKVGEAEEGAAQAVARNQIVEWKNASHAQRQGAPAETKKRKPESKRPASETETSEAETKPPARETTKAAAKNLKRTSGRRYPSGSVGQPRTVADFVVESGGIDLRKGFKDQLGQMSIEDLMDEAKSKKSKGGSSVVGTPARAFTPKDPISAQTSPTPKHLMPIGDSLKGRLAVSIDQKPKGKAVSAPDVIASLARVLRTAGAKTPIKEGKLDKKKGALGFFKVGPEVIRVLTANDIPTSAHEMGHALEKAVFGWKTGGPWRAPRVSTAVQKELAKLGRRLYGSRKPAAGYKREGWAEFVREWITTGHADLAELAPKTLAYFEGTFLKDNPEIAKSLAESQEIATRWRMQGSKVRVEKSIVDTATTAHRARSAIEDARRVVSREAWIEMGAALEEMSNEAAERLGRPLEANEDPFISFAARRMTHPGIAAYMVERGMVDFAGNLVGPPLMDVKPLIEGRYDEFVLYLYARRAIALLTDPRHRNPGISIEDAKQIVEELTSPQFEMAAQKVYDWNEGVLEYAAQASGTFRRTVEAVRQNDPGSYIPLQREFKDIDSILAKKKGGSGSVVKRLKGSGRRIKDPLQALISQAERTVLAAHRRAVLEKVLRLSKIDGMGHLAEEISPGKIPVAKRSLTDLIDIVQKKIFGQTGEVLQWPDSLKEKMEEEGANLIDETITFFEPPRDMKGGEEALIPFWDGKKMRWFSVDERIFRVLGGMDTYRMGKAADLILGVPARTMRAGTTGLRASFGLLWNPLRDAQTLMLNTRSNLPAARVMFEYLRGVAQAGLNKASGGRVTSPYLDAWMRLGGEMAQPLGQDIPHTRRAARRLAGRKLAVLDPRNVYDFYRDLIQFPEAGARVAEFRMMAHEIGWTPGEPMSVAQAQALTLFSKQVTTDFTASGEIARVINQMVPFHNAAIQGPRASIRAARHHPARFALRGLALTAATLALWWKHKDEEWWNEIPLRERFAYWHFPFDMPGGEKVLARIPRAFESGAVFAALPEAIADAWYRQDPESATAWFSQVLETSAPPVLPVVAAEAFEQLANQDFYWDQPIVPMGETRRPAKQQFNEYTSSAAIKIGDVFGVSPRRIDHAIRGVGGGVASDLVAILGRGKGQEDGPEKPSEMADTPIVGRLFRRGGPLTTNNRSVDALYSELEDAQRRQYDQEREETEEEREGRLILDDAAQAVSALSYARSQSSDEEQRLALAREAISVARLATGASEEGRAEEARSLVRRVKKEAEAVKKALKETGKPPDETERAYIEVTADLDQLQDDWDRAKDTADGTLKARVLESPLWRQRGLIENIRGSVRGLERKLEQAKTEAEKKDLLLRIRSVQGSLIRRLGNVLPAEMAGTR